MSWIIFFFSSRLSNGMASQAWLHCPAAQQQQLAVGWGWTVIHDREWPALHITLVRPFKEVLLLIWRTLVQLQFFLCCLKSRSGSGHTCSSNCYLCCLKSRSVSLLVNACFKRQRYPCRCRFHFESKNFYICGLLFVLIRGLKIHRQCIYLHTCSSNCCFSCAASSQEVAVVTLVHPIVVFLVLPQIKKWQWSHLFFQLCGWSCIWTCFMCSIIRACPRRSYTCAAHIRLDHRPPLACRRCPEGPHRLALCQIMLLDSVGVDSSTSL